MVSEFPRRSRRAGSWAPRRKSRQKFAVLEGGAISIRVFEAGPRLVVGPGLNNNVAILGLPGTGKTALAQTIAYRLSKAIRRCREDPEGAAAEFGISPEDAERAGELSVTILDWRGEWEHFDSLGFEPLVPGGDFFADPFSILPGEAVVDLMKSAAALVLGPAGELSPAQLENLECACAGAESVVELESALRRMYEEAADPDERKSVRALWRRISHMLSLEFFRGRTSREELLARMSEMTRLDLAAIPDPMGQVVAALTYLYLCYYAAQRGEAYGTYFVVDEGERLAAAVVGAKHPLAKIGLELRAMGVGFLVVLKGLECPPGGGALALDPDVFRSINHFLVFRCRDADLVERKLGIPADLVRRLPDRKAIFATGELVKGLYPRDPGLPVDAEPELVEAIARFRARRGDETLVREIRPPWSEGRRAVVEIEGVAAGLEPRERKWLEAVLRDRELAEALLRLYRGERLERKCVEVLEGVEGELVRYDRRWRRYALTTMGAKIARILDGREALR